MGQIMQNRKKHSFIAYIQTIATSTDKSAFRPYRLVLFKYFFL